jgi:site-specific DNA-methyltransferase (adenine-specific)
LELFRVSNNQIIWGANYFTKYLPGSMGWIFWDKDNHKFSLSDGELAFTSFSKKLTVFKRFANLDRGFLCPDMTIHPTQKPVKLYQWLLANYAKPGQRILDTHLGSGSSAIAAHYFGVDFVGIELDADYYKAACERFKNATAQVSLFQEFA